MFVKTSSRNKVRGIGLLELMLSLAIIAILLVMATRYFISANQSQKVNNAISMIHGIAGGAANYKVANGVYVNMTTQTLADGKYIPSSFAGPGGKGDGVGTNPWGGNLTTTGTASTGYTVALTAVPVCEKLAGMINGAEVTSAVCAPATGTGTLTVTFN